MKKKKRNNHSLILHITFIFHLQNRVLNQSINTYQNYTNSHLYLTYLIIIYQAIVSLASDADNASISPSPSTSAANTDPAPSSEVDIVISVHIDPSPFTFVFSYLRRIQPE